MNENKSIDRRIPRTKQAIRSALVALMEEKGFDNISVCDITARANINRGTFYLHYNDKFELLDRTIDDVVADFEDIILRARSLSMADFFSMEEPLPIAVEIFEYIQTNEALVRAVLGMGGGVAFQNKLRKVVEDNLKLGFLASQKPENFWVPREYLVSYIIHAHFGVIKSWLDGNCKESPKTMARILSRLSIDGPIRATGYDFNALQAQS